MSDNGQHDTAAGSDYTIVELGEVKIGTTTYRVEEQRYTATGGTMTWLTGPRGATYFLRGFALRPGELDDGVRQMISWRTGTPLRQRGNEVRVVQIGDVIEQYVPGRRR